MPAHEVGADDEGLRETVGDRLLGIFELNAPLLAGAEQMLERGAGPAAS